MTRIQVIPVIARDIPLDAWGRELLKYEKMTGDTNDC